jgi:hypothetical protein
VGSLAFDDGVSHSHSTRRAQARAVGRTLRRATVLRSEGDLVLGSKLSEPIKTRSRLLGRSPEVKAKGSDQN